jgi:hypothetical protein
MRIGKTPLKALAGLAFGASFVLPPWAFGQAPFYQGKTITIIQAREAGGTGDLRVRAQVPFLRKQSREILPSSLSSCPAAVVEKPRIMFTGHPLPMGLPSAR